MCGLAGIRRRGKGRDVDQSLLASMSRVLAHRGPDDHGVYVAADGRVGLAFRRLSIIDLSDDAHQPMSNEDGTAWMVFNGEIYNHRRLRAELEGLGHRFRSRSDGEVILHGWESWGAGVVTRLRGMFAFAVHDARSDDLFLARDPVGIKPLYYAEPGGDFVFASEIKAILEHPGVEREVDATALSDYLSLAVPLAPRTMFRGIRKVPPGHTVSVSSSGVRVERYWEPLFPDDVPGGIDVDGAVDEIRRLLRESIGLRMMSDVPFGVFLSGGLDSSLNVALMSEMMDRPVDTFSVALSDDPRSDERAEAQRVAAHFGARHREIVVSQDQFVDVLSDVAYHQDEPLTDPVCVPLYFVSRLAREHGTPVIQVGEGSDELFAGYTGYQLWDSVHRRTFAPLGRLPRWVTGSAAALGERVLSERKAEALRRSARGQELFWGGAEVFPTAMKRALLGEAMTDAHEAVAERYRHFDELRPGATQLDRMIYLELTHRLPELLLMRVDKMTMAHSVEARVPFLDQELVRFALSLPAHMKLHGRDTKWILRKAARGIVPDWVIDRPKAGFCGDANNMVVGGILDFAERKVLGADWLGELVDKEPILGIFAKHRSGRRDQGMAVWSLLNLVLWHERWIQGKEAAST